MATLPLNIPVRGGSLSTQEAGIPLGNWLSSSDAQIVLAGAGGTFSLQAEIETGGTPTIQYQPSSDGSTRVAPSVSGGLWAPVGAPMTAAGTYALTGARGGRVRLVLLGGSASNMTASLVTT